VTEAAAATHSDPRPNYDVTIVALLTTAFCASTAVLAGVTALGKQVYDMTDRELYLGLIGLAEFAPALLLVLVTGTVADRFDRRRLVTISAGTAAICALGLGLYAASDPTEVAPIFLLVIAFGVARSFWAPASRSLPADSVSADRLPWVVVRVSVATQAAFVAGPVLGGLLYVIDPSVPYFAMAALLLVAATGVQLVRPRYRPDRDREAKTPREVLNEALGGLRFVRHHPILLGAISLDLFAVLFGGAVALLPALAKDELGVGEVGLGWLRAAVGVGAAMVTLFLLRRPVTHRVGRTLLASVGVFGAFTIVLGLTSSFAVAFLAIAALAGADAISVFIRSTLVPLVTPPDVRGRVLALEMVFIGASNELGAFESGVAGELLGARGAVVLGGIASILIAIAWWLFFPALRDVDRFPSPPG
jgi:MFS family permease